MSYLYKIIIFTFFLMNGGLAHGDSIDTCAALENSTFESVDDLETGLGPQGPTKGKWIIYFSRFNFVWNYSDVQESGYYNCNNGNIQGYSNAGVSPREFKGRIEANINMLTWQGTAYRQLPDKEPAKLSK